MGTLALWTAAGASVVFWGMRLSGPPGGAAAPVLPPQPLAPDAQALARLLGARPANMAAAPAAVAAAPSSRFVLVGVLAGRTSGGGAALIAVDGKPAKPFRLGAAVDEGLVVQALGPRQVELGPDGGGAATVTLEMPLKR